MSATAVFVGREPELAALAARARPQARAGESRIVVLAGEGGIGKSTLIDLVSLPPKPRPRGPRERTRPRRASRSASPTSSCGGSARPRRCPDHLAAGATLLEALVLTPGDPLVLVSVDDAHWADPPSLAALSFVARRLVVDPVLLVLATRSPGALPEGLRKAAHVRLDLDPLDAGELAALAAGLGVELSARAAKRLHAHTAGNPLYSRELLLTVPARAWRSPPRRSPPPPRSAALVAERVQRRDGGGAGPGGGDGGARQPCLAAAWRRSSPRWTIHSTALDEAVRRGPAHLGRR